MDREAEEICLCGQWLHHNDQINIGLEQFAYEYICCENVHCWQCVCSCIVSTDALVSIRATAW